MHSECLLSELTTLGFKTIQPPLLHLAPPGPAAALKPLSNAATSLPPEDDDDVMIVEKPVTGGDAAANKRKRAMKQTQIACKILHLISLNKIKCESERPYSNTYLNCISHIISCALAVSKGGLVASQAAAEPKPKAQKRAAFGSGSGSATRSRDPQRLSQRPPSTTPPPEPLLTGPTPSGTEPSLSVGQGRGEMSGRLRDSEAAMQPAPSPDTVRAVRSLLDGILDLHGPPEGSRFPTGKVR